MSERLKVGDLNLRIESHCGPLSKVLNPERFISMQAIPFRNRVLEMQIRTALVKGYSKTN